MHRLYIMFADGTYGCLDGARMFSMDEGFVPSGDKQVQDMVERGMLNATEPMTTEQILNLGEEELRRRGWN